MTVGDRVVVTPIDNPCQYDPDWRAAVASAVFENPGATFQPEYQRYRNDPYVRMQVQYLRTRDSRRLSQAMFPVRVANLWSMGSNVSDARFRIEPLLLTAVDYDVIALDITGDGADREAIRAYERIFFNIRDNDGRLSRSCQLRQYFAMPSGVIDENTPPEAMWKMIGALLGYDTLANVWMWKDAHGVTDTSQEYVLDEMWRVAQSRLFMSMFANRVGHESMAKLLASISAQQKMLKEEKSTGDLSMDITTTLMEVLSLAAPRVLDDAASDVDVQTRMIEAVNARLDAERAVTMSGSGTDGHNGVKFIQGAEVASAQGLDKA